MRVWLKTAREDAGLTQQKLADLVDKNVTTIGKYENGERNPSVKVAKKIASILKLNWTQFFENNETAS